MKKILLVDDEPDFSAMIQMRLEASGYAVVTAINGADGIALAERERPDLIMLDVMMPGMDGFETLRRFRKINATQSTPVIMLTARGESRSIFKAQNLGVTDYLIKPCDSKELLQLVAKYA
ncbi:MAG: response regulator [Verrucomicrobia bacterium]|nr:response regulator [Verrucomicrobiota bacterium]